VISFLNPGGTTGAIGGAVGSANFMGPY